MDRTTMCAVAITAAVVAAGPRAASAEEVAVSDAGGLRQAIIDAQPGDTIVLAPGTYDIDSSLSALAPGTASMPITVRAESLGDALIRADTIEAIRVRAAHWVFENLDIEGVCADHSLCEHAFHITGAADYAVIRGNRLHGWNAAIKGNGEDFGQGGILIWPDDVVIEGNEFFNETVRDTANPVTPIDVVGGRRWTLRANFIHDHAKGQGDTISYAAFLKGNSKDGVIEKNLVVCELLHTGQVRLGLSFGGGGSSPPGICEEGTCTPEHEGGVMRNNIVVNCPADVGIYLNEAADVGVYNNTLFNTTGIDVRFAATVADVRNNLLDGQIRERDSGTATLGGNLEQVALADFRAWFTDPDELDFTLADGTSVVDLGETLGEVIDDFCNNDRDDGATDIGAVEYDGDGPCDTTRPHPSGGGGSGDADAGPGDPDAGGPGDDAGPGSDAGFGGDGGGGCCGAAPSPVPGSAVLAVLVVLALAARRETK